MSSRAPVGAKNVGEILALGVRNVQSMTKQLNTRSSVNIIPVRNQLEIMRLWTPCKHPKVTFQLCDCMALS